MQKNAKTSRIGCLTIIVLLIFVGKLGSITEQLTSGGSFGSKIEGISDENNAQIEQILMKIGIQKGYSITHDEMLDDIEGDGSKGYRVSGNVGNSTSNNIIVYTDKDGNLMRIRWADKDFYKNGMTVAVLEDYFLTREEEVMLKTETEELVRGILSAPSTAKFPGYGGYEMQKFPDKYIVSGYVDAQNGFGAMLRSEFVVRISRKENKILSFIFDGKELVKQHTKS